MPGIAPSETPPEARALHLLLIFPGPVHHLADYFQHRLEGLSAFARGTVLLNGARAERVRFGNFDVLVTADGQGSRIWSWLARFPRAAAFARERRRDGDAFDAIVTYDPLKSGVLGWWIGRRAGIPLIVEVNGDYTSPANYEGESPAWLRAFKRWVFMTVERFSLRRAAGIKLLYDTQIDAFARALESPVVRRFPDYVDIGRFDDRGEHPEILFVGFPFYLKGVDLLVDAFRSVSDDFPEWRLKLLGWFENLDEVRAFVAGHPRIDIHPPVPYGEVPDHIGRCGILVLPSRSEAMGRVLVEAMASGKPCIGSTIGGIPTVIRDGDNGLLFPTGDRLALTDALRRLMGDATLRRTMGANGAAMVREHFSPAAYFAEASVFYRDVIAAYRAR